MQSHALTNSFPFSFFTHGSRQVVKRSNKRRECLYEAIDFIRVLAYFSIANQGQKRLKYGHFEVDASPGFSSPKKAPNSSSVSLTGPDCVADCTGKASRWKLLNATT